jgi:hypothetical protein
MRSAWLLAQLLRTDRRRRWQASRRHPGPQRLSSRRQRQQGPSSRLTSRRGPSSRLTSSRGPSSCSCSPSSRGRQLYTCTPAFTRMARLQACRASTQVGQLTVRGTRIDAQGLIQQQHVQTGAPWIRWCPLPSHSHPPPTRQHLYASIHWRLGAAHSPIGRLSITRLWPPINLAPYFRGGG